MSASALRDIDVPEDPVEAREQRLAEALKGVDLVAEVHAAPGNEAEQHEQDDEDEEHDRRARALQQSPA